MVVTWSYYLTLGWSRLTSLLYFFDWKNLRKFLIISLLTNCNYSFCWNRAGVPPRNCSKDMLWYTASRNLLIALICSYHLDMTCGWSRTTNLMLFFTWMTSRNIINFPVVIVCPYSWCWIWFIGSLWASGTESWKTSWKIFTPLPMIICVYCSYSWCVSLRTCVMETMYLVFLKGFRRLIFVLTGRVYLATGGAVPILYISQV